MGNCTISIGASMRCAVIVISAKSKRERSVKVDSPDVRAWKALLADSLQYMVKLE